MKNILAFIFIVFAVVPVFGEDSDVPSMNEITTTTSDDYLYIARDTIGGASDHKISAENLRKISSLWESDFDEEALTIDGSGNIATSGTVDGRDVSADGGKLDGIATGAEVNVNADWNASGTDAEILNKPTIPTVSDTAYNATSWDANTDAATKNALRDKFESLAGGHDPVTIGTANGLSLSTQELSLAAATTTTAGAATAAQILKLDGIEALADVTDATNVNAAGAVMESDYNANTILAATADNTPSALTVDEQTLVGRITAGEITDLSAAQVRTLLNVADGATAGDSTAIHDNVSGEISLVTEKGTPVAADLLIIEDSEATNVKKRIQLSSLPYPVTSVNTATGAVTLTQDNVGDGETYVRTTNDYTDTEQSKLSGIAEGAEVNVNADWNSSSGDSQILNKPTIPTISDTAYDANSWNDNTDAATKNAIRDKIELLGGGITGPVSSTDGAVVLWDGTGGDTIKDSSITGANLTTVTNASNADSLHHHAGIWESDNGAQSVYVDATGQVGIGVASPSTLAHLYGADAILRIQDNDDASSYFEIDDASSATAIVRKVASAGPAYMYIDSVPSDGTDDAIIGLFRFTNTTGEKVFRVHTGDNTTTIQHKLASDADSYLCADNGELGIGTASPDKILHISGNAGATGETPVMIRIENTQPYVAADEAHGGIEWEQQDLSEPGKITAYIKAVNEDTGLNTGLRFGTKATGLDAADRVTINGAGNVGVGTTLPDSTFHVYGSSAVVKVQDDNSATSYFRIRDASEVATYVEKVTATGAPIIYFDPKPTDGTSASILALFRNTNTTGEPSIRFYTGDNTSTIQHKFTSGGDSYLCADNGDLAIGTSTFAGSEKLRVAGDVSLPFTTNASQTGVIYKDAERFLYEFSYGDNGTVTPAGRNIFLGKWAGNFTMGATGTETWHGSDNIGIGEASLNDVTTGFRNTGIGMNTLTAATTASYNFALGAYSLDAAVDVNRCTAVGYLTLSDGTTGIDNNTAIGDRSIKALTTGSGNTAVGTTALVSLTTGANNVAIGTNAGSYVGGGATGATSVGTSVYLGANTDASAATGISNEIVIGAEAIGQGNNTIMLGNSSITSLYCYDTSIASPSDSRIKKNVNDLSPMKAYNFLQLLRPITYKIINPADWPEEIRTEQYEDHVVVIEDEEGNPEEIIIPAQPRPEDDDRVKAGLIAQEVEAALAAEGLNIDLVTTTPTGMKTIKYGNLIIPMVSVVQKLSETVISQSAEIETLQTQVAMLITQGQALKARVDALEAQ